MKRLNILLFFLISVAFTQEVILKQTTFSTSAINASGDNSVMVGTVGQTFVGESESNSTVLSAGFWGSVANTVTSSTTFNGTESIIPVTASSGAITLTIDSDQLVAGRVLIIKKINTSGYDLYITAEGSETMDGSSSFSLGNAYESITIFCDGSNWWII